MDKKFNFSKLTEDQLVGNRHVRSLVKDNEIFITKGDKGTGSVDLFQKVYFGNNAIKHFNLFNDKEMRIDLYFDQKNSAMMIKERSIGVIKFKYNANTKRITCAAFARTLHSRLKTDRFEIVDMGIDNGEKYIIIVPKKVEE